MAEKSTVTFTSMKQIAEDLIQGIILATEGCIKDGIEPTPENVCQWAGEHVEIREEDDKTKT